jgi:predicted nicotinamide N-methyase
LQCTRQFSWHKANANKVWPGTFNLADFVLANAARYRGGRVLELGAATGALSMCMLSEPISLDVVTSDIEDEGEVERNIQYNFELNGNMLLMALLILLCY